MSGPLRSSHAESVRPVAPSVPASRPRPVGVSHSEVPPVRPSPVRGSGGGSQARPQKASSPPTSVRDLIPIRTQENPSRTFSVGEEEWVAEVIGQGLVGSGRTGVVLLELRFDRVRDLEATSCKPDPFGVGTLLAAGLDGVPEAILVAEVSKLLAANPSTSDAPEVSNG